MRAQDLLEEHCRQRPFQRIQQQDCDKLRKQCHLLFYQLKGLLSFVFCLLSFLLCCIKEFDADNPILSRDKIS